MTAATALPMTENLPAFTSTMNAQSLVNRTDEVELYARLVSPTRLAALEATGLLNGNVNGVLDRVARMVTRLVGAPISLVSLVSGANQHFPGMAGLTGWAGDARATPLSHSYCQHVVMRDAAIVISDAARDPIAAANGAHTELGIAAYIGVPLRTSEGETLGSLCAINTTPTPWTAQQMDTLEELAAMAMSEIELRSTARALLLSNRRLAEQLVRDPLTGLLNRTGFGARASAAVADARRSHTPFLVCMLDLNGFHQINATYGYDAGDSTLIEVAALLAGTFRDADLISRYGADEFVVLIANAVQSDIPYVTARMAASFDVHNATKHREFVLDASAGFAEWRPDAPLSVNTLLQRAERNMRASRAFV